MPSQDELRNDMRLVSRWDDCLETEEMGLGGLGGRGFAK